MLASLAWKAGEDGQVTAALFGSAFFVGPSFGAMICLLLAGGVVLLLDDAARNIRAIRYTRRG